MSDYVPTDSKSERENRDTDRSPDPPHNRPSPRRIQSQPNQTGPIRGMTGLVGRQPAHGIPPLRGSVAASRRAA
ncbi:hypothetical protein PGT21_012367 [Puccinia graminis f. sp. tritici]|uniref:Uncharacterized protein n=1 Tax=Puccinia graminis f. sp. tritici TaxID=56615 RepID=A0A5B0PSA6_PUCGR|nr:hypothetical protein PGT21_012367 [Puccinia graminis f. sp. tritici]KAA1103624.1 hypothetical protein PGTUg99_002223 [Puccinia graminis f. sp. tritici]